MNGIIRPSGLFGLIFVVLVSWMGISSAHAHHGWRWATDDSHTLEGTIVSARLGNPHGELRLSVEGEEWTVEVGQPWRNERAGLSAELLAPGTRISALGPRSAREGERVLKAERISIDGQHYDLYPERLR